MGCMFGKEKNKFTLDFCFWQQGKAEITVHSGYKTPKNARKNE